MHSSPQNRPEKRHLAYRSRHRAASHESAHEGEDTAPINLPDHPLVPRSAAELVVDDAALLELVDHLRSAGSFAYDSEFIGELTYHPQLCLIQVATTARVALIDPLSDLSLMPFWTLLTDPSVEKYVHAGAQDVEPVHRHTGKPAANVFDTQIAAGFCRRAYPVALSKLVADLLDHKMAKGHTFTDWQRRPLSPSQIRYAADDVRFLPAMAAKLQECVGVLGHSQWVKEECDAMCDPARYSFDAESDFLRIRGAGSLSVGQLSVLRSLTHWREQQAQAADIPPRAMVRDEALLDLARQPAKSADRLSRVKFLPRPVVERHGDTLLRLTAEALAHPPANLKSVRTAEPTPTERFRSESVWAAAQAICLAQGIDPAAVASRADIAEFDRAWAAEENLDALAIMSGWRRAALGDRLVAVLRGDESIRLKWANGGLSPTAE